MNRNVVSMSDHHMPFHNLNALGNALDFIGKVKPYAVILNGDLFDLYAYSKHVRNPYSVMTPEQEVKQARAAAEKMIDTIKKKSKKSKIFLTRGNHSMRLHKRITEKLPELIGVFNFDEMWVFDGAETIFDPRETLVINKVIYVHGWYTTPGQTVDYFQHSCVIGHSHKSYVLYRNLKNKIIWELNGGHMSDPNAVPMQYTASKVTRSTTGMGYVDEFGPRVILL